MARRKVPMKLLGEPKKRASTYARRKEGLLKKARELAELCNIPVAVVCAGPDGGAPTVWATGDDFDGIVGRYLALPAEKRARHTHVDYLRDQLDKEKAKLAALERDVPDELTTPGALLDGMSYDELQRLLASIDASLKATAERREALELLADDGDVGDGGRRDADAPLVPSIGSSSVDVHGYQHQAHALGNGGLLEPVPLNSFHPYNAGATMTQPMYNDAPYMAGHGVDMISGYQMQMQMPSNGSNNHDQLAWGPFQPCNATIVHPEYDHLQCWDNNNAGGYQMQPATAATAGWHTPVTITQNIHGEPCNAILPSAGDPYMDTGGNGNGIGIGIDTTVADYHIPNTGDNFMDEPVQLLAIDSDKRYTYTTAPGGDEAQFSMDDLLQCSDATQNSSSLNQLHYLADLADGFDFDFPSNLDDPLDLYWEE
ncbi:MADS-box transcription factor PHERES 2-like [Oryza brachyantha]|uniref:MADS-box domain-containing protein n=1 Tax=Oryza brachyantha TaxID=4533 RepID=J3L709_ORYBR|nr:MADS-box transcription factor PHERES 2-like [Oryza brachyantha]